MRRHWLAACLVTLHVPFAEATTPHRQVLTREDIESAGIVRFGDLPRLALGWDVVTRDGHRWQLVAGDARAYDEPVRVLVDGIPAFPAPFGALDLNRLPISLAQVDSVVFVEDVGMAGPGGAAIEVHTRRPETPRGAGLRGSTGGESGDPGPFLFTDAGSRNVDRIGHDGTFFGHVGWGSLTFAGNVTDQTFIGTDPAQGSRWRTVSLGEAPNIESRAYALSVRAGRGEPHALADVSIGELDDILFLDVVGREVPLESVHGQLRAEVVRDVGELQVRGRAAHAIQTLRAPRNPDEITLDWRQVDTRANVAISRTTHRSQTGVCVGIERWAAHDGDEHSFPARWLAVGHVRLSRRTGRGSIGGRLELAAGPGTQGPRVDTSVEFRARGLLGGTLTAGARWRREPFEAPHDLWPWIARGLSTSLGPNVEATIGAPPGATHRMRTSLGWATSSRAPIALDVELHATRLTGATQDSMRYVYDPDTERFLSAATLATSLEGSTVGARIRASTTFAADRVHLTAAYRVRTETDTDPALAGAWRRSARHVGSLRVSLAIEDNLVLTLLASARDGSEWVEYEAVADASGGRFRPATDGYAAVDAVVTKWLAGRRAAVSLRLENLGDARVKTHPIGPTSRFGAFAAFSLYVF